MSVAETRQRRAQRIRRGLTLPFIVLLAWEFSSHTGLVDPKFLPPIEAVFKTAWQETISGALLLDLGASLARDAAGFVIGASLGVGCGLLLGLSDLADRLLGPLFHSTKQIAVLAWIPLISVWFGFAETAKIVFIALAAFVPIVLNTQQGARSASDQLIEVTKVLQFTLWQRLRRLYIPSALPSILTGIHLGLIYSWLATVGAEYFMTVGPGIGGMVIAGRERFQMDLVMLGVVILGAVGYALNALASRIETRALAWRG
jgi:sulfonate transport system permease protein